MTGISRNRGWRRRAQSSTEYIVFVTAVVSVVVVFMNPSSGVFQKAISRAYNLATNEMIVMSGRMDDSHDVSGSSPASDPGILSGPATCPPTCP